MSTLINIHQHMFAPITTQLDWDETFDQPVENLHDWHIRHDELHVSFKDGATARVTLDNDGFDAIDWDSPLHARLERSPDGDLDEGDLIESQGDNVFDMKDELENLRRLARYITAYPADSNSEPEVMGAALDEMHHLAQRALEGERVLEPEPVVCDECDEGGIVYKHLIGEHGCPCCGNADPSKFVPEEA